MRDKPKNVRTAQCPTCSKNIIRASLKEDELIDDVVDLLRSCMESIENADKKKQQREEQQDDDHDEDEDDGNESHGATQADATDATQILPRQPGSPADDHAVDENHNSIPALGKSLTTHPKSKCDAGTETPARTAGHRSAPLSVDRSAVSAKLMAEMQHNFSDHQVRTDSFVSPADGALGKQLSLTHLSRTRAEADSYSKESTHMSHFFDQWPYATTSGAPAGSQMRRLTAAVENVNGSYVAAGASVPQAPVPAAKAVIGNSTPIRPSFEPMASYFVCSPITRLSSSCEKQVTFESCRQILARLSASLPLRGRNMPPGGIPLPLLTSPSNKLDKLDESAAANQSSNAVGRGTRAEDGPAAAASQERDGHISRGVQTEGSAGEQSWYTFERSASSGDDSLTAAITRLCHEFSSGEPAHPEFVTALQSILMPVVQSVLTDLIENGKLNLDQQDEEQE
jgi:hypothetical protein